MTTNTKVGPAKGGAREWGRRARKNETKKLRQAARLALKREDR